MVYTFRLLATLLLLAIVATMAVGFWSMALPGFPSQKDIYIVHFSLGLFTAIGILFVHCLIFIYFLGTGRWVKEVTLAYRMPDAPNHKTTRELKRRAFPPALFALLVNLWAFRVEYDCVRQNAGVIRAVMLDVDRIRAAHGLCCNDEALAEEA